MTLVSFCVAAAAICTLGSGLTGAWYWFKSSRIVFYPYKGGFEPVVDEQRTMAWIAEIVEVYTATGRLNKIAARWTAVATAFGAVTTFLPMVLS